MDRRTQRRKSRLREIDNVVVNDVAVNNLSYRIIKEDLNHRLHIKGL